MNDEVGTLIEPGPVPFTWGAPGWYVLACLLLLLIVAVVILAVRHYRKNRYRRDALSWLSAREKDLLSKRADLLVYEATMLLKRIVMARYGRPHAAIREGDWIAFLNETCRSPLFAEQDARWLTQVLYAASADIAVIDVKAFLGKTKSWIKRHRYAL